MSNGFQFQHFLLKQERSAQKMSTDSMLLGAVAELEGAMNILDIGTGTGVIALMMAQKHPEALVDAVELDKDSADEAAENFESSPWNYRLTMYAQRIQDFVEDETLHYDLIVSNPPYFERIETTKGNNEEWPDERRLAARTHDQLSFDALMQSVAKVFVSYGKFYVVIPGFAENEFNEAGSKCGLYPIYRLEIAHDEKASPHRLVLAFSKNKSEITLDVLKIRNEAGGWSEKYKKLTADFHSK